MSSGAPSKGLGILARSSSSINMSQPSPNGSSGSTRAPAKAQITSGVSPPSSPSRKGSSNNNNNNNGTTSPTAALARQSSQRSIVDIQRKSSSVFTSNVRVLHPNAAMIIRAIVADDVLAFARELVLTQPTPEQLARKVLVPGVGYISDASPDEENCTAKYYLREDNHADCGHLAASNDAFAVLNFLLRMKNADVKENQTIDTQWTPLHFGAFNQSERICALLRSSGAELFVEDVYGDRPCDIAALFGNRYLAERLGDTSSADEGTKKDQAYQQLLAQAKAYEEERARDAEARRKQYEQHMQLEKEKRQAIEDRRKLKSVFEIERLSFLRDRWLLARQSFLRDFLVDRYQRWAEHMELAMAMHGAAQEKAAADRIYREEAERRRIAELQRRKSKKGSDRRSSKAAAAAANNSSDNRSPPKTAGTISPTSAAALPPALSAPPLRMEELSALEQFLSLLPEEPLPEVTDRMNKEQKAAVVKQRNKMIKERKARREEATKQFHALEMEHYYQQEALEEENLLGRVEVEQQWFSAFGNLACYDPSIDRKHSGFFRYEAFDDRYRWSCCGQVGDPFALGCLPAEDRTRMMVHTGALKYHIHDCPCGGTVVGGASPALVASSHHTHHDNSKTSSKSNHHSHLSTTTPQQPLPRPDGNDDVIGTDRKLSGFVDEDAANRQKRNQRRVGPEAPTYCNPGGCCWTCCGATLRTSPGCTSQNRFLFADHLLCDVRFLPADVNATVSYVITSADGMEDAHRLLVERAASPVDIMNVLLEERSQMIVSDLLVPTDPESATNIAFIIGENGVNMESEADRDVHQQDPAELERIKYSHGLRRPKCAHYITSKSLVRISNHGRTLEHLTPPLTSRKTCRRVGPASTLPLQARVTRTNLLGNFVLKGDFLADVRRGDADGSAALAALKNLSKGSRRHGGDDDDNKNIDDDDSSSHSSASSDVIAVEVVNPDLQQQSSTADSALGRGDDDAGNQSATTIIQPPSSSLAASPKSVGSPLAWSGASSSGPSSPGGTMNARAVDPSEIFSGIPTFASWGNIYEEHPGDHAAYAFEMRITACPIPVSVTDERLVIGVVQAELPPPDEMPEAKEEAWNVEEDDEHAADDDDDDLNDVTGADEEAYHATGAFENDAASIQLLAMADGSIQSTRPNRRKRGGASPSFQDEPTTPMEAHEQALEAARNAHRRKTVTGAGASPGGRRGRAASVVTFENENADDAGLERKASSVVEGPKYGAASPTSSGSSFTGGLANCFSTVVAAEKRKASIFHVPRRTRAYFAREGSYISGPYGIGWWAHTNSLRGHGLEYELPEENYLREGDLVTFVVDGMNNQLHLFHNRAFCQTIRLPHASSCGYVPAVTLVARARVDVEYVGTRLPYVFKWWREKAMRERMLRLTVSPKELDVRLASLELAKKKSSMRGGPPRSGGSSPSGSSSPHRHRSHLTADSRASSDLRAQEEEAEIRY
ncbi:ankyrin repeat protein, putative [Bodo saltans]|uniref:Ankyrin repeat protein, putative n=1 Tax=Bodo saltans TaxID=75058 RepID=A0A0S4JUQ4_BODSA|nr:ankyrin repeat protein, putative [Bodo saltans]|eukprot:CUG92835.1 ankyrin repeat protein, putative [Bodo saltans]